MESWNQRYLRKPGNYTKVYQRKDLENIYDATKSIIHLNNLNGFKINNKVNPGKLKYYLNLKYFI